MVKVYRADPNIRDNSGKKPRQYMMAHDQVSLKARRIRIKAKIFLQFRKLHWLVRFIAQIFCFQYHALFFLLLILLHLKFNLFLKFFGLKKCFISFKWFFFQSSGTLSLSSDTFRQLKDRRRNRTRQVRYSFSVRIAKMRQQIFFWL